MSQLKLRVSLVNTNSFTPRNTSPPDDAPRSPTSTAPARAKIPRSAAHRHSPPASTRQTASSDLPGSGTPGIRTNSATRDTSDGTNPGYAANPRPQFPTPAA